MEIECCSLDDDDMYASLEKFPRESNWNGHKICVEGDGISHLLKPMEVGGSGQITFTTDWGGKEGPQMSLGASGKIHDDRGNYAEVSIKQESSGKGSAEISAGHEKNGPQQGPTKNG